MNNSSRRTFAPLPFGTKNLRLAPGTSAACTDMTVTRFTSASLVGALVLIAALLFPPQQVVAQESIHPTLFALTAGEFPSGSLILRSSVEGNRRLLQDLPGHFGLPPQVVGRITGYYMVAETGQTVTEGAQSTSYLISIFSTKHQAQSMFGYLWDLWYMINFYTIPEPPVVQLGDQGSAALFHTLDSRLPPTTELMFRRGRILVEVFQESSQVPARAEQMKPLYSMAMALDAVARAHPHGI